MADMLDIACPECGKEFQVPVTAVGKKVRCKTCGEVIPIAGPSGAVKVKNTPRASPGTKAAAKPAAPPAARTDGELDDGKPYGLTNNELGSRCPECANAMNEGDVICLTCGYNIQTRERARTRKLLDYTGFDIFLYLLPGILCVVLDICVLVFNILFLVKNEDWFPKDSSLSFLTNGFFKVWLVVPSLFILFYSGRFALRRLIFNPQPPEVEVRS